jgi:hypothetical protein
MQGCRVGISRALGGPCVDRVLAPVKPSGERIKAPATPDAVRTLHITLRGVPHPSYS